MLNYQVFTVVKQYLAQFAATDGFESLIESIFGGAVGADVRQQWLNGDFNLIPEVRVVSNGELGTANGAYAASFDQILVSAEFLAGHEGDVAAVTELLLEEIGHKLDRVLNGGVDSLGDEGAMFRLLVMGQALSAVVLAGLRVQDDHAVIVVDGSLIEVEKQDFVGDAGGITTNDIIIGTMGEDSISGLGGNDALIGLDSRDILDGGVGDDTLTGGTGADVYVGGEGNDVANLQYGDVVANTTINYISIISGEGVSIQVRRDRGCFDGDKLGSEGGHTNDTNGTRAIEPSRTG